MKKNGSARRRFIKSTTMGLAGLSFSPVMAAGNQGSALSASVRPEKKLRIVCAGAHPGDPEFGCGGTMMKYANAGHSVTFLYLTRGEAYDPGQSFEQSAALRTKEALASCKILNAKPVFAGQIDGNTVLNKESIEVISKLIEAENPDLVFTQWPLDAHPDHQAVGLLIMNAWVRTGRKFQLYFYEVNTGSETMDFSPTDYVDISDTRDKKKAAMFAHKTQSPEDIYNNYFKTLEDFRGLEAGVKAAEGFIHFKDKTGQATIAGL